jgi:hypothetical protein
MRFNIQNFWLGRKQPASVRKKNSQSLKLAYQTGKHKKVWKGKHFSKLHKQRLRLSNLRAWKSAKLRNKLSRVKKRYFENPKNRDKIDRILTEWYREHPKARQKMREMIIDYYLKNPKAFQKFLNGGKNHKLHIKSKLGLVRSKPEKIISNYLYNNKIKAEYEKYSLFLKPWICTPDWYVKGWFIEYYGGHPKSYKKKIIKNKLYKKYNIPVIAIQPYELRDLSFLKRLKPNTNLSWKKFVMR